MLLFQVPIAADYEPFPGLSWADALLLHGTIQGHHITTPHATQHPAGRVA